MTKTSNDLGQTEKTTPKRAPGPDAASFQETSQPPHKKLKPAPVGQTNTSLYREQATQQHHTSLEDRKPAAVATATQQPTGKTLGPLNLNSDVVLGSGDYRNTLSSRSYRSVVSSFYTAYKNCSKCEKTPLLKKIILLLQNTHNLNFRYKNKDSGLCLLASDDKILDSIRSMVSRANKQKEFASIQQRPATDLLDPTDEEAQRFDNMKTRGEQRVDPITGKPSTAKDAIKRSTFNSRQRVDPITGKKSTAPGAIPRGTFKSRQLVDPITGKLSTATGAIPRATFEGRQLVDPTTGKLSTATGAIKRSIFKDRQRVDPITGKLSTAEDAIIKSTFKSRQRVDPITGKPSTAEDAIPYWKYQGRNNAAFKRRLEELYTENRHDHYRTQFNNKQENTVANVLVPAQQAALPIVTAEISVLIEAEKAVEQALPEQKPVTDAAEKWLNDLTEEEQNAMLARINTDKCEFELVDFADAEHL